jgi:hypothetical protein
MNEQYRGFNLYGGSEPISETLLDRVTQWKPTGSIAHKHRNGAITELVAVGAPLALGSVLAPQIYPQLYHAAQVSAAEL